MSIDTEARPAGASAYPVAVESLIGPAKELTRRLGKLPSRNKLMTEFKIGAPKARVLRDALDSIPADQEWFWTPEWQAGEREASEQIAADDVKSFDSMEALFAEADAATTEQASEQASVPAEDDASPAAVPDASAAPANATSAAGATRRVRSWPVLLLALPAFVAIWSGWVGLGEMTGFGVVHPLPGLWDSFRLNTAITLPVGVETYAAFALRAWLSPHLPARARRFARYSAIGSLLVGGLGQVAYHLMAAADITRAPWQITTAVACLPVAVLGMGAALAHLLNATDEVA